MRITNARLHTGFDVFECGEVVVEGNRITAIRELDDAGQVAFELDFESLRRREETGSWAPYPSDLLADDDAQDDGPTPDGIVVDVDGAVVAPGFVDLMVNGGGGIHFNESPERVLEIAEVHRWLGTTSILPNLITDSADRMRAARTAVDEAAGSAVLGIHFEGPLLSPVRRGMHAEKYLTTDFPIELARRTDRVATLVTLAPEVAEGAIHELVDVGARVALGHSDATLEEFRAGVGAGGRLVTHMFNAMRPFAGRDPGIVGGGLTDDRVWVSVINDGVHVDYSAVLLAWRAKPEGKCFYVSDAMPPVPEGYAPGEFVAVGERVSLYQGVLHTASGGLGGSMLDMATAVRNGVREVGIPLEESIRMASTYPSQFLGVGDRVGSIFPGRIANLVVLDDWLEVSRVMFEGEWVR